MFIFFLGPSDSGRKFKVLKSLFNTIPPFARGINTDAAMNEYFPYKDGIGIKTADHVKKIATAAVKREVLLHFDAIKKKKKVGTLNGDYFKQNSSINAFYWRASNANNNVVTRSVAKFLYEVHGGIAKLHLVGGCEVPV